jgi:hypothetical protein
LPFEAIQVLEHTPSRVVILDPPYYSLAIIVLAFAACAGAVAAFLYLRQMVVPSALLLLIFLVLAGFGSFLMTRKRLISLDRSNGLLKIEKTTWGVSSVQATLPLDQIQKAIVENVRYTHSLVVVVKSGEAFALGGSSDRQGYFGAVDAINDFLGRRD